MSIPYGPSATSHKWEDKTVTVSDSLIIGTTDNFDCSLEPPITHESSPQNWPHSGPVRNAGIIFPSYGSSPTGFGKPWHFPKSYNTIRGTMHINDVTFANFGNECGRNNAAIRTNPDYEDMQMPIIASNISFINVATDHAVFFDNPSLGKINPSDCVDMPCDAKKKALIMDTDGSLTGSGVYSTVIPDNSFQWDGDRSYGQGYYRVPKTMITDVDGNKIPFSDVMPNVGIVQSSECSRVDNWNAIHCQNLQHRHLVIESMDKDTEVRRVSPIGVLSENGYIDLINGPQDHGWCFGYTCQERLSTFHALVAINQTFEVHMTSTPPQHIRYHLLNSQSSDYVVVKFYYPKRQRYDVFVDGIFIPATNGNGVIGDGYDLLPPGDEYIPVFNADIHHGANFYDPRTGHLYVAISGSNDGIVDVVQQPIVVFKFGGSISNDDFFDINPVQNIANLLGIDPSKIRIANIVRENSRRRKRNTGSGNAEIDIDIGPGFQDGISNDTDSGSSNFDDVSKTAGDLQDRIREDKLPKDQGFSADEAKVAVQPSPPPVEPPPIDETQPQVSSGKTFAQQSLENDAAELEASTTEQVVSVPTEIVTDELFQIKNTMKEMVVRTFQFYLVDQNNELVTFLDSDAWTLEVTVLNNVGSLGFNGDNVCTFATNGYCDINFSLDTQDDGYILRFTVYNNNGETVDTIDPSDISDVVVAPRPLDIIFSDYPKVVPKGVSFSVVVSMWDAALDTIADPAIGLPDNITCELSLNQGSLDGVTTQNLNPACKFYEFYIHYFRALFVLKIVSTSIFAYILNIENGFS